jgi:hypothetical protein
MDRRVICQPPAGFSSSDQVFNDNFSGTTLDKDWHNCITSNVAKGAPGTATVPAAATRGNLRRRLRPSQPGLGRQRPDADGDPVAAPRQGLSLYRRRREELRNFEFDGGYLQSGCRRPAGPRRGRPQEPGPRHIIRRRYHSRRYHRNRNLEIDPPTLWRRPSRSRTRRSRCRHTAKLIWRRA